MKVWQPLETIPKCGRRIRVKGYYNDTQTRKITYSYASYSKKYEMFIADAGWFIFPTAWKEIQK